jgi:hypothetical protein
MAPKEAMPAHPASGSGARHKRSRMDIDPSASADVAAGKDEGGEANTSP